MQAESSALKGFFIGKGADSRCPFHRFNHHIVEDVKAVWGAGRQLFQRREPILSALEPRQAEGRKEGVLEDMPLLGRDPQQDIHPAPGNDPFPSLRTIEYTSRESLREELRRKAGTTPAVPVRAWRTAESRPKAPSIHTLANPEPESVPLAKTEPMPSVHLPSTMDPRTAPLDMAPGPQADSSNPSPIALSFSLEETPMRASGPLPPLGQIAAAEPSEIGPFARTVDSRTPHAGVSAPSHPSERQPTFPRPLPLRKRSAGNAERCRPPEAIQKSPAQAEKRKAIASAIRLPPKAPEKAALRPRKDQPASKTGKDLLKELRAIRKELRAPLHAGKPAALRARLRASKRIEAKIERFEKALAARMKTPVRQGSLAADRSRAQAKRLSALSARARRLVALLSLTSAGRRKRVRRLLAIAAPPRG